MDPVHVSSLNTLISYPQTNAFIKCPIQPIPQNENSDILSRRKIKPTASNTCILEIGSFKVLASLKNCPNKKKELIELIKNLSKQFLSNKMSRESWISNIKLLTFLPEGIQLPIETLKSYDEPGLRQLLEFFNSINYSVIDYDIKSAFTLTESLINMLCSFDVCSFSLAHVSAFFHFLINYPDHGFLFLSLFKRTDEKQALYEYLKFTVCKINCLPELASGCVAVLKSAADISDDLLLNNFIESTGLFLKGPKTQRNKLLYFLGKVEKLSLEVILYTKIQTEKSDEKSIALYPLENLKANLPHSPFLEASSFIEGLEFLKNKEERLLLEKWISYVYLGKRKIKTRPENLESIFLDSPKKGEILQTLLFIKEFSAQCQEADLTSILFELFTLYPECTGSLMSLYSNKQQHCKALFIFFTVKWKCLKTVATLVADPLFRENPLRGFDINGPIQLWGEFFLFAEERPTAVPLLNYLYVLCNREENFIFILNILKENPKFIPHMIFYLRNKIYFLKKDCKDKYNEKFKSTANNELDLFELCYRFPKALSILCDPENLKAREVFFEFIHNRALPIDNMKARVAHLCRLLERREISITIKILLLSKNYPKVANSLLELAPRNLKLTKTLGDHLITSEEINEDSIFLTLLDNFDYVDKHQFLEKVYELISNDPLNLLKKLSKKNKYLKITIQLIEIYSKSNRPLIHYILNIIEKHQHEISEVENHLLHCFQSGYYNVIKLYMRYHKEEDWKYVQRAFDKGISKLTQTISNLFVQARYLSPAYRKIAFELSAQLMEGNISGSQSISKLLVIIDRNPMHLENLTVNNLDQVYSSLSKCNQAKNLWALVVEITQQIILNHSIINADIYEILVSQMPIVLQASTLSIRKKLKILALDDTIANQLDSAEKIALMEVFKNDIEDLFGVYDESSILKFVLSAWLYPLNECDMDNTFDYFYSLALMHNSPRFIDKSFNLILADQTKPTPKPPNENSHLKGKNFLEHPLITLWSDHFLQNPGQTTSPELLTDRINMDDKKLFLKELVSQVLPTLPKSVKKVIVKTDEQNSFILIPQSSFLKTLRSSDPQKDYPDNLVDTRFGIVFKVDKEGRPLDLAFKKEKDKKQYSIVATTRHSDDSWEPCYANSLECTLYLSCEDTYDFQPVYFPISRSNTTNL